MNGMSRYLLRRSQQTYLRLVNEFLKNYAYGLYFMLVSCSNSTIPRAELNALMVAKGIPLKPAVVNGEEEGEGHDEM